MQILEKPLTNKEMITQMKKDGMVSGIVKVELNEVIHTNLEGFLDLIGVRLTNSELLMNISYDVVGHRSNTLYIKTTGDACEVIADEDTPDKI